MMTVILGSAATIFLGSVSVLVVVLTVDLIKMMVGGEE